MFADPIDKASQIEEESRQRAIAAARANTFKLPAKGQCYNCDEPLEGKKLYCDADCATDHEKYLRAQRMR